jgi:hypothetical protein
MSHTLHRRGSASSLHNDFVLFAMSAKEINDTDSAARLRRFLEIVGQYHPVNMGDMKTGNRFITTPENVLQNTQDTSIVHAVFASREDLVGAMRALEQADLGISVIVSGLFSEVHVCCQTAGVKPHTEETSLGIWGNTKRLPDEDILQFTTMCGHGQIAFELVKKVIADVKAGRKTLQQAAEELARPCQCGVFNPVRARKMLEEVICLWSIRSV